MPEKSVAGVYINTITPGCVLDRFFTQNLFTHDIDDEELYLQKIYIYE